jgi:hypothetical protein
MRYPVYSYMAAIILSAFRPGYGASDLAGVWTLNRAESKFGTAVAPEQVVVRMERTGSRLVTCKITTDSEGKHLVYREYTIEGKGRSSVDLVRSKTVSIEFPRESIRGTKISERWQVSKRRLIIRRSITAGPRKIHLRLVLDPATQVHGTHEVVRQE